MSERAHHIFDLINLGFTVLYTIEAILMIVGLGLRGYFQYVMNMFDFFILVISWVEVGLFLSGGELLAPSSMRAMRLLRILKLIRSWVSLRNIVKTLIRAIPEAANLFFLILIFNFMNALVARQLFAKQPT